MEKKRLTVGCRARILPPAPKNRKDKRHFENSWREYYPNREVILKVRTCGGNFSMLVLVPGTNVPLTRGKKNVVDNQLAWVSEEDMVLVDSDFDTNLNFIDWYEEHEENYCENCGRWYDESTLDVDFKCSNKKCSSKHKEGG